jgi:uncharacterized protein involved in oxidation of intracellular sulfur
MKTGIVIYSNDSETVWNAFRLANFTAAMNNDVSVFILGKGVELENLDTETFKIKEQVQEFLNSEGKIFTCGTCLEIHKLKAPENSVVATLKDLYDIIEQSDRLITF